EDEKLAARIEVDGLAALLEKRDDDRRHVDVDQLQLLLEHERQQQVEGTLERVEGKLELADRGHRRRRLAGRADAALRNGELLSRGRGLGPPRALPGRLLLADELPP